MQEVDIRAFDDFFSLVLKVGAVVVFIVFTHFEEHIFQVAVTETVGQDIQGLFVGLQLREQLSLSVHVLLGKREFNLYVVLLFDLGVGELPYEF